MASASFVDSAFVLLAITSGCWLIGAILIKASDWLAPRPAPSTAKQRTRRTSIPAATPPL